MTRLAEPLAAAAAPATAAPPLAPTFQTVADLLRRLGDVPPERVRLHPAPGTATEADLLAVLDAERVPCELVDGTLVEKPMGYHESRVAGFLLTFLNLFLMRRNLGAAAGPDGVVKLTTGLTRVPDVSFVSWAKLPGRTLPADPIPQLPLDLAVEVLSSRNTPAEIDRKVAEYFDAGVRLVWLIDPRAKTGRVYTSPTEVAELTEADALDGGAVLPGFVLPLRDLFAHAGPDGPQD